MPRAAGGDSLRLGLERTATVGRVAAVALPAVAGKFGVRGGGYLMSNSSAWQFTRAKAIAAAEPNTRSINMNSLGLALEPGAEPPIKVLFVYNSNVLVTSPNGRLIDRGLQRDDLFTVVYDQVWTDTAKQADLVLPATAFPEHHELSRGYGAFVMPNRSDRGAGGRIRPNCASSRISAGAWGSSRKAIRWVNGASRLAARRGDRRGQPGTVRSVRRASLRYSSSTSSNTPDRKVHLVPEALDPAPMGLYGSAPCRIPGRSRWH